MNKNLIKDQNQSSLIINKKSSVLLLSVVVCFPNWNSWADAIELDNNNFNQYLNADHPVKGHYRLISDIDLGQFLWKPVGNTSVPFSLILDGNGRVISGLNVSTSTNNTPSGLFGSLQNSTIRQILLNQPKVTSSGTTSPTGALAGELKGSRIEEVVNYAGTLKTSGFLSHAGGLAGSVYDSVIINSVNTGTVLTTGSASTGGIAGLADQASFLSNDLNTGKIVSRNLHSSPAGGIVGTLKSDSIAINHVNTGEVNVGFTEYSGGIVGEAEAAKVLHNLNTGNIASDYSRAFCRLGGSSGGIVGHASRQSLVSKNLNTGSIFTRDWRTYGGGIAGDVVNTTVVQNVNAGTVTTHDFQSSAGGITGEAEGSSIRDNLNIGAIMTKAANGHLGGITGAATLSTSVYDNVNTGSVEAQDVYSYVSGVAGRVWRAGPIEHNLDTFTKYQWTSERGSGRNKGVIRLSKSALKSNETLLNSRLWNVGDASQLPMLRGINIPHRDLARMNGNQQRDNSFPSVLNEFADPGGDSNATSFNRTVWNGRDGYLPFLKIFSKPQTLLAGIDCTQGSFDCGEETTSSVVQPSTTHSHNLSDHCPPPEGTPIFQAYDSTNERIYVVIQPEPSSERASKEIILARYQGAELDKQFGLCGVVTYTTSTHHARMLGSYPSLTGQVILEATDDHLVSSLNVVAVTTSGKATLFEFPLTATLSHRAQFSVKRNPAATFDNNDIDTINSQQDILMQQDQVYVANLSPEGEKLSIRRYATDNGLLDSAFIIDDWIDFSSPIPNSLTTVRLITTEHYLHAVIYSSDGRLSVFTYKDQVKVHRFDTTFKPASGKTMRPVLVANKAYLAVKSGDIGEGLSQVQMQEIVLDLEGYNHQGLSATVSEWRVGFITGCTAVLGVLVVIEAIRRFTKELLE